MDRKQIDGRDVERITAFLFHRGGHDDPVRLKANAGKSFQGSIVLGMGFTFDDTDTKGVASPLSEMHRLIEKDPRNQEVIFPYIGGQEVNTSPTHAHHRYVINFRDYPLRRENIAADGPALPKPFTEPADSLTQPVSSWAHATDEQRRAWLRQGRVPLDYPGPVAADWPDALTIAEERVKPERVKVNRQVRRDRWWQFGDRQPALYAAIAGLERLLAISQTSKTIAFAFLRTSTVYSHKLIVFPYGTYAAFSVLQSRPHEIWARFFGSTMKDDAVYTPSDCFDTFPFPDGWETDPTVETAGQAYYEFRASLMIRNDEGPDEDLQPLPRSVRKRSPDREAPRTPRRHGPRRPRRLRLDRHPHRLRVPPRLRDRRGRVGQQEETVPLPLARRRSATKSLPGCWS